MQVQKLMAQELRWQRQKREERRWEWQGAEQGTGDSPQAARSPPELPTVVAT